MDIIHQYIITTSLDFETAQNVHFEGQMKGQPDR